MHQPARGLAPNDETAFLETQRYWGPDRDSSWPPILRQAKRLDHQDPDNDLEAMYYYGMIVIDLDNHPVWNFEELPLVLSSNLEDWRAEALRRLDCRVEITDLLARMVSRIINYCLTLVHLDHRLTFCIA